MKKLLHIVYGNIDTTQFPIRIKSINHLSSPSKKVTEYEVPGRDGKLYVDEGTFEDFILEVRIFIKSKGQELIHICNEINRWLFSDMNPKRLSISNTPDDYYIAIVKDGLDINKAIGNNGECTIKFICRPLKRSVYGDSIITITTPTTIYNDEGFESKPYLKVFASGDVNINISGQPLILKGIEDYIEIDTDLYNCFKDKVNQNNKMYSDFPILYPGENNISWEGNISKIELQPRYNHL